jgi:hypothetical protein
MKKDGHRAHVAVCLAGNLPARILPITSPIVARRFANVLDVNSTGVVSPSLRNDSSTT